MKLSIITPTHNPKFLPETWASVRSQTHADWEWVIVCTDNDGKAHVAEAHAATVRKLVAGDPRVRVEVQRGKFRGVGERKNHAFGLGVGEALVELDHDDLLTPDCLEELVKAFADPDVGFVYSDFADFEHGAVGQGNPDTYRGAARAGWVDNGFQFYSKQVTGVRPGLYECVAAFEPSAAMCSLVFWAPNHVRAWRRSVYHEVGGHDVTFPLADDHELLMRTYAATKFVRVRKPLYLYRVHTNNTWSQNVEKIRALSFKAREAHLESTILAECTRLGLPAYDLGGAFGNREGWQPVDIEPVEGGIQADLRQRWPWADNSVGAFRAIDFLEHLPDKLHTMSEMHRCLRPGGWAVTFTPSTDGRGAFMDPTHVSFWNEPAFWYWTRKEQAAYIRNTTVRFQAHVLHTESPTKWHVDNNIPYVRAVLVALKPGYHPPGEILI